MTIRWFVLCRWVIDIRLSMERNTSIFKVLECVSTYIYIIHVHMSVVFLNQRKTKALSPEGNLQTYTVPKLIIVRGGSQPVVCPPHSLCPLFSPRRVKWTFSSHRCSLSLISPTYPHYCQWPDTARCVNHASPLPRRFGVC